MVIWSCSLDSVKQKGLRLAKLTGGQEPVSL
jgi:hypothetical protein